MKITKTLILAILMLMLTSINACELKLTSKGQVLQLATRTQCLSFATGKKIDYLKNPDGINKVAYVSLPAKLIVKQHGMNIKLALPLR